MIKIMHTGDLHIGNFPGPEVDGENARFKDICGCLDDMVEQASIAEPDIAIIAGDIFHQARVWSDRGLKENQTAISFLRRLAHICPVVVMRGTPNHDSVEQFNSLETAFEGDDSVDIVTEPGISTYYSYDGKRVEIACLPGFDRGYYRSQHPGLSKEEENEVFTEAIRQMIIGLKAQSSGKVPCVFVSHYTVVGCNMESGQTAFFSQFEPVIYPDTLQAAGYDLVCMGHIHRPQQIEGCGENAFYCGAISALNFNDEGQDRGFWIHTLDDDGERYSEFHKLPTRQYQTIMLDNGDVEALNLMPFGDGMKLPEGYPDVTDKVVRVIYDCTDEVNKAFNHALLEKMLYESGAFWVQEITPRKISVSVDKKSMDVEDSPEDNLMEYIKGKEITPELAERMIELARPIISEATEQATNERRTGLFVPVEIEVKNYRNYREEVFNYDPIRFCTINGENGAGKSSLFMDAMRDALFEEPREGDLTGWICNDPQARSGMIKFTFRIGETMYRVTRTRAKSGKATLNISELVDGEWENRSAEKYKDTQKVIENIIGMDSLMLTACALIMQDQYGVFLEADKEARMNIIGNILGLAVYSSMEEKAGLKATDTNREVRKFLDQINVILDGIPDAGELKKQIGAAKQMIEGLAERELKETELLDSLKVNLNTQLEAAGRAFRLNTRISTLTSQKAGKAEQIATQTSLMLSAKKILDQEEQIKAGAEQYRELQAKEKDGIKLRVEMDMLESQQQTKIREMSESRGKIKKLEKELQKDELQRNVAKRKLLDEQRLKVAHEEFEKNFAALKEMQEKKKEYQQQEWKVMVAERDLRDMESIMEKRVADYLRKIAELERQVEKLNNSGCPDVERANCLFLKDAIAAKEQLPKIRKDSEQYSKAAEEQIAGARSALDLLRQALGEIGYSQKEETDLLLRISAQSADNNLYLSLESARKEMEMLTGQIEKINLEIETEKGKYQAAEDEADKLDQTIIEKENLYSKEYDVADTMKKLKIWIDLEQQLTQARAQHDSAVARVAELNSEVVEIAKEIEATKAEYETVKDASDGTETLQKKVDQQQKFIDGIKEDKAAETMKLGRLKARLEDTEQKIKKATELQKQADKAKGDAAAYDELKAAFSQDGIPHNIIRSVIPVFEATATNILGQMSQGRMSVEFVMERVLKSNNKKEVATLDIIINDCDTGRLPYMSRSGGERVKAALAVILALAEIMKSKAGVQLGMLFIDEPPFLDNAGSQAYCTALETIQSRYPDVKVMAITHDNAFKARFPQSVTVSKDVDGSHVVID